MLDNNEKRLEEWLREFIASQQPLPREFAKVIDDNYWYLLTGDENDKRK